MTSPAVILVRPQLGENIGAVARAMANFGLTELRMVAPRDGWPNSRAFEVSSGATHILEQAQIFADFASATADCHQLYATTARPRDMEKRVVTPREAAAEIMLQYNPHPNLVPEREKELTTPSPFQGEGRGEGYRAALVFGPERTGLENAEIAQCDTIITIPTDPEFFSLNLAQSVIVVGYELWCARAHRMTDDSGRMTEHAPSSSVIRHPSSALATKADWHGLFGQLEGYLDEVNYYRVPEKKDVMWQNLQTMLMRGQWTAQELQSFRGLLRSLWERERKAR
ncbi:MAG: RNA methyltransferase [Alphaproteobacteria bacterium]|nr:RNA methyltransferase [Alphaproteobacteria bacterium]